MIKRLACSLGRNDEVANIELAMELIKTKNKKGICEIVNGLQSSAEPIANDCIKVLYEIGDREPLLIADHVNQFL